MNVAAIFPDLRNGTDEIHPEGSQTSPNIM